MEPTAATLQTKRLCLRSWQSSDLDAYYEHCETRQVLRWLHERPRSKKAVKAEIEEFQQHEERHGFTFWALERKADKALLGFCGLFVLDYEKPPCTVRDELEIGWRLRSDAWSQGFASEAAVVCMEYAFANARARRVVSRTVQGNVESWSLMKRLGMHHEFGLDYGKRGKWRNVVWTIDWSEWREIAPGIL